MDNRPDFPSSNSPRRELQGPRPTPLKVRKDSYKIKKPPVVPPQQSQQPSRQPPQAPPRAPVIIYTVSPKVIHTKASDFMDLVQRLTGSTSSSSNSSVCSSSSSAYSSLPINDNSGDASPAARYAVIEKTKSPQGKRQQQSHESHNVGFAVEGTEMMSQGVERVFPSGILSPGPASLPPISPSFFSPPTDPNFLSFLHDLSPLIHGNKNFVEGNFMPSPNSSFVTTTSPTPSIDYLFNNFFDL